ncbi:unnamed protein product [Brassica rapa subsp. trilocularis]
MVVYNPRVLSLWAWPFQSCGIRTVKVTMRLTSDVWVCVKSFKISDGFIRVFVMRLLLPLFYEDCFGGYTVFAYGFNLFLYREEYFATMPPLYERRCFLGSITEALLQFIHQFVILWSGL